MARSRDIGRSNRLELGGRVTYPNTKICNDCNVELEVGSVERLKYKQEFQSQFRYGFFECRIFSIFQFTSTFQLVFEFNTSIPGVSLNRHSEIVSERVIKHRIWYHPVYSTMQYTVLPITSDI